MSGVQLCPGPSGSAQVSAVGSCESNNETSSFVKGEEFDCLSD
jgi:hypothetical protein